MGFDGTERKRVTDSPISAQEPSWSPDGKKIAFILQGLDRATVATIDADGTGASQADRPVALPLEADVVARRDEHRLFGDVRPLNSGGGEHPGQRRYTAPEFEKSALVTIDVQRDVLEGQPLEIPGSSAAAEAIGRLAGCFRQAGPPIVHIVRLYRPGGSNVDPCRRDLVERGAAILAPGSPGTELAPGLLPGQRTRLDWTRSWRARSRSWGRTRSRSTSRAGARSSRPHSSRIFVRIGDLDRRLLRLQLPELPTDLDLRGERARLPGRRVTDAISGLYERGARELEGIGVALLSSGDIATAVRGPVASPAAGWT